MNMVINGDNITFFFSTHHQSNHHANHHANPTVSSPQLHQLHHGCPGRSSAGGAAAVAPGPAGGVDRIHRGEFTGELHEGFHHEKWEFMGISYGKMGMSHGKGWNMRISHGKRWQWSWKHEKIGMIGDHGDFTMKKWEFTMKSIVSTSFNHAKHWT